jgi:hypothetical protein
MTPYRHLVVRGFFLVPILEESRVSEEKQILREVYPARRGSG